MLFEILMYCLCTWVCGYRLVQVHGEFIPRKKGVLTQCSDYYTTDFSRPLFRRKMHHVM